MFKSKMETQVHETPEKKTQECFLPHKSADGAWG